MDSPFAAIWKMNVDDQLRTVKRRIMPTIGGTLAPEHGWIQISLLRILAGEAIALMGY